MGFGVKLHGSNLEPSMSALGQKRTFADVLRGQIQRPGNGDFDDMGDGGTTSGALSGGVSFACRLLFDGSTARKMPYTPQIAPTCTAVH